MNLWDDPGIFEGHRIIEASAGTGKTYSLVRLAVSLIEQGKASIEQVLIVTYTEKAMGELRMRLLEALRERIEAIAKENEESPNDAAAGKLQLLRDASENYELASIFTIHAFCQRVLQQYAFENRQAGEAELVDDAFVYRAVLKDIQRKDWPLWLGADLGDWLAEFGYPSQKDDESSWEKMVISLASRWVPEAGDLLLPQFSPAEFQDRVMYADVCEALETAVQGVTDVLAAAGGREAFLKGFQQLKPHGGKFRKADVEEKMLSPFFHWAEQQERGHGLPAVMTFHRLCWASWKNCSRFTRDDKHDILPGEGEWPKSGSNLQDVCPQLPRLSEIQEHCKAAYSRFITTFPLYFKAATIRRIVEAAESFKTSGGYQSYQDILSRVWKAIEAGGEEGQLLQVLRQRYKYALIDEFQDTDSLQWRIFREIFTKGDEQKIMLIGDPKQSIYRFRGADVHSYWKAESFLKNMDPNGYKRTLDHNWRACENMILGLNDLFSKGEMFKSCKELDYQPVHFPKGNNRIGLSRDTTGRAPLTVVTIHETDMNTSLAKVGVSRFIVDEIARLLTGPSLRLKDGSGFRDLNASDICILLRGRGESSHLERMLQRRQIPYSFYKQPGVWQSQAAMNLNFLLKALAYPEDAGNRKSAFLTDFFRIPPQELGGESETHSFLEAESRLTGWGELAANRKWALFFQALLEESGLRCRLLSQPDAERIITNYTHLIQSLEAAAVSRNFDIRSLAEWMDRRYRNAMVTGEEEYHRTETEAPKVRLMTMHAAKGLEFPVVFILGGLSQRRGFPSYLHYSDKGHVCYNQDISDEGKALRHRDESLMEELQLLYVALTRAQYKLYIPKFIKLQANGSPDGVCGFVSRLLYPALEKAWPGETCNNIIRHVTLGGEDIKRGWQDEGSDPLWKAYQPVLLTEKEQVQDVGEAADERALPQTLASRFPTLRRNLWPRHLKIASFSSLHKTKLKVEDGRSVEEEKEQLATIFEAELPRIEDEFEGDAESSETEDLGQEEAFQLPKGERTGSMLHELLEEVNYAAVARAKDAKELLNDSEVLELIDRKLGKFRFAQSNDDLSSRFQEAVAGLVFNTLKTPLDNTGFRICDLGEDSRIHEMEFWYPYPGAHPENIAKAGIRYDVNGYLNGFIDLVFKHDGKFFLLDWKSNFLETGYDSESLKRSMQESHYLLQYRIYILALRRWLKLCGRNEEVEGVYYLFLRGMDIQNPEKGIYRHMDVSDEECLAMIQPILQQS